MAFVAREAVIAVGAVIGRVSNFLPRIPSIEIQIGLKKGFSENDNGNIDPRLIELGEELSQNGSSEKSPFFIDNGLLKAAPKKKVSHQKKRQKLLAPGDKQIKFLHNLNRCPTCGNYKRSHFLCMHCVGQIKRYWKDVELSFKPKPYEEEFSNEIDSKILYPGKKESEEEKILRKKEYLQKRPKSLPVEHD